MGDGSYSVTIRKVGHVSMFSRVDSIDHTRIVGFRHVPRYEGLHVWAQPLHYSLTGQTPQPLQLQPLQTQPWQVKSYPLYVDRVYHPATETVYGMQKEGSQ